MNLSTIKKPAFLPDSFGFILILGICVLYFVFNNFGLQLASIESPLPIWVPTGIIIASFLLFGYRIWPVIFVVACLVNFTINGSLLPSLFLAVGNTTGGFVGVYLINRFAHGKHVFDTLQNFYKFILFAVLLSTVFNATFGALASHYAVMSSWENYGSLWTIWWLGDMMSALIFTPALLLWGISPKLKWEKLTEFLILIALILFVGLVISKSSFYFAYLIIPILIWVALRFSTRGTATAIAFFSIIAIEGVKYDSNSFNNSAENQSLFLIQTFIAFISLVVLPLSITLTKQKRESREDRRLAQILNSGDSAVIGKTFDGTIISWNLGAEKIYGYTKDEMIGKNISSIIPKEEKEEFLKIIASMKDENKKIDYLEATRIRKDGSYIDVSMISSPVTDEQGEKIGVSMISNDITEKKRRKVVDQQKRIIEEERLRSEFISNAAHEIRTPLAIIKGNIDLALGIGTKKLLDPNTALYAIDEEVAHLSGILGDLLLFTTKNERSKKETYEKMIVPDFIKKIVERCKTLGLKKNISIELEPTPEALIMGNENHLDKVFSNIIKNAITYGKDNGLITVSGLKTDKHIKIIIADNGIGISKENLPHIFERFFRADKSKVNEGGRVGLGLVIVKQIVEEHGGTVGVESTLGVGTTFTLTFPLISSSV